MIPLTSPPRHTRLCADALAITRSFLGQFQKSFHIKGVVIALMGNARHLLSLSLLSLTGSSFRWDRFFFSASPALRLEGPIHV